jgi:hypothetical protein
MRIRTFPTVLLTILLAACAAAPRHDPDADAHLGIESYLAGRYDMAEFYLTRALTSLPAGYPVDSPRSLPWRHTLANVYWETGRDDQLLSFSSTQLPKRESLLWRCRVDEREGYTNLAHSCYLAAGDDTRAARAMRSAIIIQTFTPDNTRFGVPPVSPP